MNFDRQHKLQRGQRGSFLFRDRDHPVTVPSQSRHRPVTKRSKSSNVLKRYMFFMVKDAKGR